MPIPAKEIPRSFARYSGKDRHGHFRIIVRKKFLELFKKTPHIRWGAPISLTKVAQSMDIGPSLHKVDEIRITYPVRVPLKKGIMTQERSLRVAEKVFAAPEEFFALYRTLATRRKAVHPIALKAYTSGHYKGMYYLYTKKGEGSVLGAFDFDRMDYHARSTLNSNLAEAFAKMHHFEQGRPAIIHYDAHPLNVLYAPDRVVKDRIRFLDMDASVFLDRKPTFSERMDDLKVVVKHAAYDGLHKNLGDVAAFAHEYCKREGLDFHKFYEELARVHEIARDRVKAAAAKKEEQ
jgi:hypothetical protein